VSGLVLHHAPGCALSQAVRIVLAEKGLEHALRTVDTAAHAQFDPASLALNPAGQLPVLEAEGAVLSEAFFILCYLDDRFPEPPFGGSDPAARYRVQYLGKLVEGAIAPNLALLEWAKRTAAVPPAEALDRLPRERRMQWRKAIHGSTQDEMASARASLARALKGCEAWLAENAWLAGSEYTLADMLLFPLIHRMDPGLGGPR
jgi:glutathione S-transferase